MNKSILNELFEINQHVYGVLRFFPNSPVYHHSKFIHLISHAYSELEQKSQDWIVPEYSPLTTSIFNNYFKKTWIKESIVNEKLIAIYLDYINRETNKSNLAEVERSEKIISILKCLNLAFKSYIGSKDEKFFYEMVKTLPEKNDLNIDHWSSISIHYEHLSELIKKIKSTKLNQLEEILSEIKINKVKIVIKLNEVLIGILNKWANYNFNLNQWVNEKSLLVELKHAAKKKIKNEMYYDSQLLKEIFFNFGIKTRTDAQLNNHFNKELAEFNRDSRLIYIHNFRGQINNSVEYMEFLKKDSLHSDEIFILYCVMNNEEYLNALQSGQQKNYPYKVDLECFKYIVDSCPEIQDDLRKLAYNLDWEKLSKKYFDEILCNKIPNI